PPRGREPGDTPRHRERVRSDAPAPSVGLSARHPERLRPLWRADGQHGLQGVRVAGAHREDRGRRRDGTARLKARITCPRSRPPSTSSFVTARRVRPLTRTAIRSVTRSSHPTLRGRRVVVPYSPPPRSRRCSAIGPSNSVGNGPEPTREVNAFATPRMSVRYCGPMPAPTAAAPATQSLEVPYG